MSDIVQDKGRFVADVQKRNGEAVAGVVQRIFDWAEQQGLTLRWGKGKTPYFGPKLMLRGAKYHTFGCYASGTVEMQFRYMGDEVDTDGLLQQVMGIPGVNVTHHDSSNRPSVYMSDLAEANRLDRFLAVWDWYLDEVRKANNH